jgi:tetratricopeptide (TPR) repeat protein
MAFSTLTAPFAGAQRPVELAAHTGGRRASCSRVAVGRRRRMALACAATLGVAVAAVFVHWVFIDHVLFRPKPVLRSGIESVATTSDPAEDVSHWILAMDHGRWQPVGRLSLIAQLWAHGPGHDDFVLANIALHAVVASLLFLVILKVARNALLAACSAGAFAAHPAAVPAVASFEGCTELVAAVLGLLAILWYLDFRRRGRRLSIAASVLCSTAAALASSALIAWPVFLPLVHTAISRKRPIAAGSAHPPHFVWRRLDWRFWSILAAALVASVSAIGEVSHASTTPTAADALRHRRALLPGSIATQLGRAAFPHWTAWELAQDSRWTWWVALGTAAMLIGICLGSIVCIRRIPMICAGGLWFVGAVIPAAGIAVLSGRNGQHACAYIPLIGSVTAAVFLVWTLVNSHRLRFVAIPLIAAANVAILARMSLAEGPSCVERWADFVSDTGAATMREASGRSFPEPLTCTETNWLDAMAAIDSALDAGKDSASVQCKTGTAFETLGDTATAVLHYRRASKLDPNCFPAEYNLGLIDLAAGKWSEAEQHFWRAVEIAPTQGRPYIAMARIYEQRGATFEAIEYLKRALELEPDLSDSDPGARAIYPAESVKEAILRLQESLTRSHEGSEAAIELSKTLTAGPK